MIYAVIIAAVIVLDRIVKALVKSGFEPGDTVAVLGDFFHITYVQNRGVAFSMLYGHQTVIIILTAAFLAAVLVFLIGFNKKFPAVFNTGLALVCGGGLSNIVDRTLYGYVVDMLDFGSFPVFNVADICICVGCGLMLLYALRSMKDEK
ncbi:MAG: signal peptidase II [Firmicutes bacterium]|nr:signal peptidase II [Bacillota bacterium]